MERSAVRVWTIFDGDGRVALTLSDQPGPFQLVQMPAPGTAPIPCAFATAQCYSRRDENRLLTLAIAAQSIDEFLDAVGAAGFRVVTGRPRAQRFARL